MAAAINAFHEHTSTVFAVAWSPDGTRIASGSNDDTAQVWDASTGRVRVTYTAHSGTVYTVVWSPDGMRIASATGNLSDQLQTETLQVWRPTTGQLLGGYPIPLTGGYVDGRRVASGGADAVAHLWTPTFCVP